jgi:hypothetical protein
LKEYDKQKVQYWSGEKCLDEMLIGLKGGMRNISFSSDGKEVVIITTGSGSTMYKVPAKVVEEHMKHYASLLLLLKQHCNDIELCNNELIPNDVIREIMIRYYYVS